MKHGKKATRQQKKLLLKWRLDPAVWLVTKDTPTEMHLVHRHSNKETQIIPKGGDTY